jgi:hypothetical protein
MNIFILSTDPKRSAKYHSDKHVVKMILESAQMLSTAIWESGGEAPYRSAYKNHPCTVWARTSRQNFIWLTDLALALCEEYTYRYGKYHKSEEVIRYAKANIPDIPNIGLTPFAQAMPEQYKNENPVKAYRDYYIAEKKDINTWKYTKTPKWYEQSNNI